METYCAFTTWPEPIEVLETPVPPFPDISASIFLDMAINLSQLKGELTPEEQAFFELSYQRIFEPFWGGYFNDFEDEDEEGEDEDDDASDDEDDIKDEGDEVEEDDLADEDLDDEDEDEDLDDEDEEGDEDDDEDEGVLYTPDLAQELVTNADLLPLARIGEAFEKAGLLEDSGWTETEHFLDALRGMVETFREAAAVNRGVVIGMV